MESKYLQMAHIILNFLKIEYPKVQSSWYVAIGSVQMYHDKKLKFVPKSPLMDRQMTCVTYFYTNYEVSSMLLLGLLPQKCHRIFSVIIYSQIHTLFLSIIFDAFL